MAEAMFPPMFSHYVLHHGRHPSLSLLIDPAKYSQYMKWGFFSNKNTVSQFVSWSVFSSLVLYFSRYNDVLT